MESKTRSTGSAKNDGRRGSTQTTWFPEFDTGTDKNPNVGGGVKSLQQEYEEKLDQTEELSLNEAAERNLRELPQVAQDEIIAFQEEYDLPLHQAMKITDLVEEAGREAQEQAETFIPSGKTDEEKSDSLSEYIETKTRRLATGKVLEMYDEGNLSPVKLKMLTGINPAKPGRIKDTSPQPPQRPKRQVKTSNDGKPHTDPESVPAEKSDDGATHKIAVAAGARNTNQSRVARPEHSNLGPPDDGTTTTPKHRGQQGKRSKRRGANADPGNGTKKGPDGQKQKSAKMEELNSLLARDLDNLADAKYRLASVIGENRWMTHGALMKDSEYQEANEKFEEALVIIENHLTELSKLEDRDEKQIQGLLSGKYGQPYEEGVNHGRNRDTEIYEVMNQSEQIFDESSQFRNSKGWRKWMKKGSKFAGEHKAAIFATGAAIGVIGAVAVGVAIPAALATVPVYKMARRVGGRTALRGYRSASNAVIDTVKRSRSAKKVMSENKGAKGTSEIMDTFVKYSITDRKMAFTAGMGGVAVGIFAAGLSDIGNATEFLPFADVGIRGISVEAPSIGLPSTDRIRDFNIGDLNPFGGDGDSELSTNVDDTDVAGSKMTGRQAAPEISADKADTGGSGADSGGVDPEADNTSAVETDPAPTSAAESGGSFSYDPQPGDGFTHMLQALAEKEGITHPDGSPLSGAELYQAYEVNEGMFGELFGASDGSVDPGDQAYNMTGQYSGDVGILDNRGNLVLDGQEYDKVVADLRQAAGQSTENSTEMLEEVTTEPEASPAAAQPASQGAQETNPGWPDEADRGSLGLTDEYLQDESASPTVDSVTDVSEAGADPSATPPDEGASSVDEAADEAVESTNENNSEVPNTAAEETAEVSAEYDELQDQVAEQQAQTVEPGMTPEESQEILDTRKDFIDGATTYGFSINTTDPNSLSNITQSLNESGASINQDRFLQSLKSNLSKDNLLDTYTGDNGPFQLDAEGNLSLVQGEDTTFSAVLTQRMSSIAQSLANGS